MKDYQLSISYRLGDQTYTWSDNRSNEEQSLTVSVENEENRIRIKVSSEEKITILCAMLKKTHTYGKDEKIFVNGYQSWTDTKEFLPTESLHDIRKLPKRLVEQFAFDGYGDVRFKTYHKHVLHGFELSYADDFFVGSVNRKQAYLIIDHRVQDHRIVLESDCKGYSFAGEFTVFDFFTEKQAYLSYVQKAVPKKMVGYTSWYLDYENINEEKLLRNLEGVKDQYEFFQIDDGYETYVGDWLDVDPVKFPNGIEPLLEKIHEKGLLAGIWLAPLIAEEKSRVYRGHPEWFLPVKAGSNWSGFYGLDLSIPEARDYVKTSLTHYAEMGFDFFKLDFLYAVNLKETDEKTRAMITDEAYALIREALPGKIILGCGAIPSNASDYFDYLRIGPDVSLIFDDAFYMRLMHRERISTKVTMQNTIYRSFLDGVLFGNDPDVFLLRDDHIKLSKEQKEALLTINALFGSLLMTSDHIEEYDEEKKALFEKALTLRNATDKHYERCGRYIQISYRLNGQDYTHKYDTKKGVLR